MTTHPRILVVDDESRTRRMIAKGLTASGFRVLEAADGPAAIEAVARERPALVLLDVDMPGLNGFQTLDTLRRRGYDQLVLMLTSFTDIEHRVRGLTGGADDYLGKPFDLRELLARVQALLRRGRTIETAPRRLQFGDVVVDLTHRSATCGNAPLALTRTEFDLLDLFAHHLGQPVSRELMLDAVWGYTHLPRTRTVETHIWRLRKKLGDRGDAPRWIRHQAGTGYTLTPDVMR